MLLHLDITAKKNNMHQIYIIPTINITETVGVTKVMLMKERAIGKSPFLAPA